MLLTAWRSASRPCTASWCSASTVTSPLSGAIAQIAVSAPSPTATTRRSAVLVAWKTSVRSLSTSGAAGHTSSSSPPWPVLPPQAVTTRAAATIHVPSTLVFMTR